MGGGILQLVAVGEQNLYLTGNPQFSYFKKVYKRHANFAIEAFQQVFTTPTIDGSIMTTVISRNGDLLSRIYLTLEFVPDDSGNFPDLVYQTVLDLIDYISVEIGGQEIVRHTGEFLYLWFYLTYSSDQYSILRNCLLNPANNQDNRVYIPLQFWFCRDTGLALPLIALQYHHVRIQLKLKQNLKGFTLKNSTGNPVLWCDYIFLDTDERKYFAQKSHEYLIEQVQFKRGVHLNGLGERFQTDLVFQHPVKELIWVFHNTDLYINNYWNEGQNRVDQIESMSIYMDNEELFDRQLGNYYRNLQVFKHHTYGGGDTTLNVGTSLFTPTAGECIYVYSFALRPEEHQPTGTCNFSMLKKVFFDITLVETPNYPPLLSYRNYVIYAINYNILKIESGVGGALYKS